MKKILFVAAAALALIGCQKQSELNFSDISTSATVKGKVTYEIGYKVDGSQYVKQMVPATDIEVVAKINYSEYSEGAVGVKQITAKTDAEGNYTLVIPVGQKAISLTVEPRGFESEYMGELNASNEVIPTTAYFRGTEQGLSVMAGDVKVLADFEMLPDMVASIETRNLEVKIAGKVKTEAEIPILDTKDEIIGAKAGNSVANCKVRITFSNLRSNAEIVYNDVTVTDGEYTLTANLYDVWNLDETYVQVESQPYLTEEFVHYYYSVEDKSWRKQSIAGIYSKAINQTGNGEILGSSANLVTFNARTLVMTFTPTSTAMIRGIGNPDVDEDKDGNTLYNCAGGNPFGFTY
ncbi:MAG TPA: hypothetical protein DIW30_01250 [Bacteroidales bacterium]|nr:hypothetical protein [Bacteroidales bacterium]